MESTITYKTSFPPSAVKSDVRDSHDGDKSPSMQATPTYNSSAMDSPSNPSTFGRHSRDSSASRVSGSVELLVCSMIQQQEDDYVEIEPRLPITKQQNLNLFLICINCFYRSKRRKSVKIDMNIERDLAYALKVKECPQILFLKGNRVLYREKQTRTADELVQMIAHCYYKARKPSRMKNAYSS